MKVLVLLVGTSASGKSSVRKILVPEPHDYHNAFILSVCENKKGYGYVGRGKAGSEVIKSMFMFQNSIEHGLRECSVVVVDTVRITKNWVRMINSIKEDFSTLIVHFNFSESELIDRLLKRRIELNLPTDCRAQKALQIQEKYLKSTSRAVEAMIGAVKNYAYLSLTDELETPEQLSERIEKEIQWVNTRKRNK